MKTGEAQRQAQRSEAEREQAESRAQQFEALKLESTDKLLPGTDMSKQVTFHGKASTIDDVLTSSSAKRRIRSPEVTCAGSSPSGKGTHAADGATEGQPEYF